MDHKKKSAEKAGEGGLAAAYANVTATKHLLQRGVAGEYTNSNNSCYSYVNNVIRLTSPPNIRSKLGMDLPASTIIVTRVTR
jgi:hypothetical protein